MNKHVAALLLGVALLAGCNHTQQNQQPTQSQSHHNQGNGAQATSAPQSSPRPSHLDPVGHPADLQTLNQMHGVCLQAMAKSIRDAHPHIPDNPSQRGPVMDYIIRGMIFCDQSLGITGFTEGDYNSVMGY